MTEAEKIVAGMLEQDAFSRWLGIEVAEIKPGKAVLRMTVRSDMLNGHRVCHGGVTFALADTALAFAANAHGQRAASIECTIAYPTPAHEGDVLTATAEEQSLRSRIGIYHVVVENQHHRKVGLFHGIAYRTEKDG
jgi:acyl-CoA thioesterase